MKKAVIILLLLTPLISEGQYKHKSEAEIARMTPSQRVDEYIEEDVHHKYDLDDDYHLLVWKYIKQDGLKALPRIIEVIDAYDPTRSSGRRGRKADRFEAAVLILSSIDESLFRVRAYEEGRRAIEALERAVGRMRAAGYEQSEKWSKNWLFRLAFDHLKSLKEDNIHDSQIRDTLRYVYKINLSDEELVEFSNWMVEKHPDYPGWERAFDEVRDESGIRISILKRPERYYEAYMEFKRSKR